MPVLSELVSISMAGSYPAAAGAPGNRISMLKRQIFGRARFELLRKA
ncbi:hypothetical protein OG933_43155 [Streptomyces sp. NBC_00016]